MPSTIKAGTVLDFKGQTASDNISMECQGTEQQPAFIVGGTLKGNGDVFQISGSWCYFIDTKFEAMQPRPSGHHIVFRNVEVFGSKAKNGMNIGGSEIVVTGSEIHHNQRNQEDAHGIQIGQGTKNVWILDSDIHHNSGNGLQACHGCSASPPSGIFIGNNVFHSDREVGIGLKYADNVIIEGNTFHSYVASQANSQFCFDDGSGCGSWNSGSDGSAIVVGADGAPTGVVIVGNEIHTTRNAVRIEESNGVQVLDNNFHDIDERCLTLDKDGMGTVYRDNTCANTKRGIHQHWRDNFTLTVDNNIFKNLSEPAIEYETRSVCDASTLTTNQFTSTGPVICGNTTASTTAEVNALPGASGNTVN